MKRKIMSMLFAMVMLIIPLNVYADTPDLFEGADEIVVEQFSQTGIATCSMDNLEENLIFHNNGYKIKSDYFAHGKDAGNCLMAVKYEKTDYGVIETAYFSNVEKINVNELITMVSESDMDDGERKILKKARIGDGDIVKKYSWSFYAMEILQAKLTTTVTFERRATAANVNGKVSSVWDVTTFSQLEKKKCMRLNNQYTRLSVDVGTQELLSYGPIGSSSGGDVTVGLDRGGVASASYTFNINGFSVKDKSSMSGNYGRWAFVDNIGNESSFTTEPGIRAANSKGNFVTELSHTVSVNSSFGFVSKHHTGVITISCPDR